MTTTFQVGHNFLTINPPPEEPAPLNVAPPPTGDDLADVVGNHAWFNNLSVSGAPVGGPQGADLLFIPDNTFNIGTSGGGDFGPGTNRPRNIFVGTSVIAPIYGSPGGAQPDLKLATNGTVRWTIENTTGGDFFPAQDQFGPAIGNATHRLRMLYVNQGFHMVKQSGAPPETPPATALLMYFKTDGKLYTKDSASVERLISN